ncbi:VCBS repeat-containing protein [Gammaproteobacteria bacterium LSUCC0112]|nr:VCBS repeat-containing protein [Gammaproteobacteria bacterium LSUCC0112]
MNLFKTSLSVMGPVLLAMTSAIAAAQTPQAASYTPIPFTLHPDTSNLRVKDLDGDGLQDLLAIQDDTLSVYFQRNAAPAFDFTQPDSVLTLPGQAAGWDIPEAAGTVAGSRPLPALIALIDGQRVLQWQINNRAFSEPQELISNLGGFLGKGAYPLNFYQDINNDGLPDLVVPGAGVMNLLIQNADGSFQPPLSVQSEVQQRVVLEADGELDREIGQSLIIPQISLRDVNGDDLPDLISDTEARLDVFLASRTGDYFPTLPNYSIDREAIRERLGEFDLDQLDFSNLTGVLALTHEELLEDMNGDGIDDFILREGGRVALHLGQSGPAQASTINLQQPDQILRSSGNVLSVFLADENDDGRPDLWLWRVDQVSIGDLFLWLAVSGTINMEAFVYPNEGNQFARRPSRRITVAMRFPSVVRMIGSVQESRDRARSMEPVIPFTRAQVLPDAASAQAAMDDLLVLANNQLEVFYQAVAQEPPPADDRFLASLGYRRGLDSYEIDLRRIVDAFNIEVNAEVNEVRVREPNLRIPLPDAAPRGDLVATDLNNNGIDDIFVFISRDLSSIKGVLYLSD